MIRAVAIVGPQHGRRMDGGQERRRRIAARLVGELQWLGPRKEPAALAMIWGYLKAALNREPQLADADARAYLRRQQSLRLLPSRAAEAIGRRRRVAA